MKNQIMTFNNAAFTAETICCMSEIHPSVQRLYSAARELRDVTGPSAVARLLGASPQTMNNWESRGISEGGALKAQQVIGCDANWVLHGNGLMEFKAKNPEIAADRVATYTVTRLWPFKTFTADDFMQYLDEEYRQKIEDQLLGAITRMKQTATAKLSKHG